MDMSEHSLSSLFAQLGLANDAGAIEQFIEQHKPLAPAVALADAEFWNTGQAAFITESLSDDSDWAELVDQLDAMLRH